MCQLLEDDPREQSWLCTCAAAWKSNLGGILCCADREPDAVHALCQASCLHFHLRYQQDHHANELEVYRDPRQEYWTNTSGKEGCSLDHPRI